MMKNWILIFIAAFTFLSITDAGRIIINNQPEIKEVYNADIIIYGGTSAAIIAAVEVVKSGKTVLIVSPDQHLGGLTSGGLGFTDTGNKAVIGGLSREFYHRVWLHYKDDAAWNWQNQSDFGNKGQGTVAMDGEFRTMWLFEPHVAEKVFEDFVRENNIKVLRGEWLDRKMGVVKKKGNIISFSTLSGKVFKGKMFIDATYEGDLMAAAGINYHVGREGNAKYNETFNGVQTGVFQHDHHFKSNISPYKIKDDPSSGLLPYISAEPPGEFGAADKKIQAYCFRMCMTNHPENSVAFPKPDNYDASKYELLLREFNTGRNDWFSKFDVLPNKKTDTNNHGAFSSDFIGMNYDYPEADYQRRDEIIKQHYDYQAGLLWFVANDPRVPDAIRTKMASYGLAKDEFKDNNHWPHQIYVRESRRMIGDYITTEHDVMQRIETPESIGMGSYHIDSHNTQRYVTSEGYVQNEGDIGVKPPGPYRISYGSIVPKKEECTNLFVPVCVSSSHIAYGSIRMEPVFMILGQSAAVAACLAIDEKCAIQDVSYNQLKKLLENNNQILAN
ncbi:MAG: FAD-dependent oxidoreductase [Saprospiraceae bacterium]|nr:FAD-dependent oxidoreductase [Saprospiraceae bacterium]